MWAISFSYISSSLHCFRSSPIYCLYNHKHLHNLAHSDLYYKAKSCKCQDHEIRSLQEQKVMRCCVLDQDLMERAAFINNHPLGFTGNSAIFCTLPNRRLHPLPIRPSRAAILVHLPRPAKQGPTPSL